MASYTKLLLTTENPIVPSITGTDARDKVLGLGGVLTALASGTRNGQVVAMKDAVRASGTVTLTYAKLVADETIAIGGTTLTIKNSGANGTTQFNKQTNATTTAANLAACINANTTLNKIVVASAASGVVTITAIEPGVLGNVIDLVVTAADPTGWALSAARLADGTAGTSSTNNFGV